jgi:hypothetical protein
MSDVEQRVRVSFQTDGMKLARDGEERSMTSNSIKLARGRGPGAVGRCPACDGPYDVLSSGFGWTSCPHCDTQMHFSSDGEVTTGEVIAASRDDGLSPIERRLSRQFGLSAEEMRAAKQ